MKRIKLIILAILVLFQLVCLYQYFQNETSLPMMFQGHLQGNRTVKRILYWTRFYSQEDFYIGFGQEPFSTCEVSQCEATANKSLLSTSDALLFHLDNLDEVQLPEIRYDNQRWIFFTLESPSSFDHDLSHLNGLFNWTMTYRRDSDIYDPYGLVVRTAFDSQMLHKNYSLNKSKQAVWFVSHCHTKSLREKYVKELQKYISVDIYGACGDLKCPSNIMDECLRKAEQQYKFYLSFENSLCDDYVTEKLFNALRLEIIPVVYGIRDYSQLVPPDSVINILDFDSPQHLATHLQLLDENDELYNQYFKWKAKYKVTNLKSVCNLCEKLHDPNLPSKTYDDLDEWWRQKGNCTSGENFISLSIPWKIAHWFIDKWKILRWKFKHLMQ